MPLLEVHDLKTWFPVGRGLFKPVKYVKAVDGVSFTLDAGEVLAVIGESGSGKTTLGRTVLRLIRPTAGKIVFDGKDITYAPDASLKWYRFSTAMLKGGAALFYFKRLAANKKNGIFLPSFQAPNTPGFEILSKGHVAALGGVHGHGRRCANI